MASISSVSSIVKERPHTFWSPLENSRAGTKRKGVKKSDKDPMLSPSYLNEKKFEGALMSEFKQHLNNGIVDSWSMFVHEGKKKNNSSDIPLFIRGVISFTFRSRLSNCYLQKSWEGS